MKKEPVTTGPLPKSRAASAAKADTARKANVAKPTAWGQGVLKKIEQLRMALALEK